MKFKLEFDCDSEAFGEDETDRQIGICNILDDVMERINFKGEESGTIRDVNGNRIGHYALLG